jgi:hypothetical protein
MLAVKSMLMMMMFMLITIKRIRIKSDVPFLPSNHSAIFAAGNPCPLYILTLSVIHGLESNAIASSSSTSGPVHFFLREISRSLPFPLEFEIFPPLI